MYGAAVAAKYDTLKSRTWLSEAELQARWRESGLPWSEWIDWTLAEMDAIEASLRQADLGIFASKAEVEAVFERYGRKR